MLRALLATSLGVAVGALLIVTGLGISSALDPRPGDIVVWGAVVDDGRTGAEYGPRFIPIVEYTDPATGLVHRAEPNWTVQSRPEIGTAKEISFSAGEPANGRVVLSAGSWLRLVLSATGAVAVTGSGIALVAVGGGGRGALMGNSGRDLIVE